jgi:hypothetical protein
MTRLTLELPACAAAKLAPLTPAQLAELSATLGYEVKSVTLQPSEQTRRSRANAALYDLTTKGSGGYAYLDTVPWEEIDTILAEHGFEQRDGQRCVVGAEGRVHYPVSANTWLLVSWYRMPSGRYEVISYVS